MRAWDSWARLSVLLTGVDRHLMFTVKALCQKASLLSFCLMMIIFTLILSDNVAIERVFFPKSPSLRIFILASRFAIMRFHAVLTPGCFTELTYSRPSLFFLRRISKMQQALSVPVFLFSCSVFHCQFFSVQLSET